MPPPFKVVLTPHDPRWAAEAEAEGRALAAALGANLLAVHHIGSTAVPGIRAKPILDLLPVAGGLVTLDACRSQVEALGYEWWANTASPAVAIARSSTKRRGGRRVQLHCFAEGASAIRRHLAFRDHLRANPDVARDYEELKRSCQSLHPDDSHAYGDCKGAWVARTEAEALAALR